MKAQINLFRTKYNCRKTSNKTSSKTLALLPYELWVAILELAICPTHALPAAFDAIELDQAHRYLWVRRGGQVWQPASNKILHRNRLRRVCRLWNEIIKHIKLDRWGRALDVSSYSLRPSEIDAGTTNQAPTYQPVKTDGCTRLNETLYTGSYRGGRIRYTKPVAILWLHIFSWEFPYRIGDLGSLSDVISFPNEIEALIINYLDCSSPTSLLQYLETQTPVLTTLAIRLSGRMDILSTNIHIPTLKNLFLSIPNPIDAGLVANANNLRWELPALRNLSLEEHYIFKSRPHYFPPPTHAFFAELVRVNSSTIEALRLDPMTAQFANSEPALSWTKLPRLKYLFTDFGWIGFSFLPGQAITTSVPTSPCPVRHLIHLATRTPYPCAIADQLITCMGQCKNVESVTLLGEITPYRDPLNQNWFSNGLIHCRDDREAMKRLITICNQNNIQLRDRDCELFH
ncbi:hypothetical protein CPB86DRAFT_607495 [Serendipita vermifera]|nr:hypothetical protein CPB86DRAFT_607495 [Serendipita vermifera]